MRRVRALGHVGRWTALQVPIGEPRDLAEERRAQACFEPPANAERHCRDRHLEEQEEPRQAHDRSHRREALAREGQVSAEIEQASKKQCLHDDAGCCQDERDQKSRRCQNPVRLQQGQEMSGRLKRRFAQRGNHFEWQLGLFARPVFRRLHASY